MAMSWAADNGALCEVPMTVLSTEGLIQQCDLQRYRVSLAGGPGPLGNRSSGNARPGVLVGSGGWYCKHGYYIFACFILLD